MQRYDAPQTIDEAIALLAAREGAFALGGGTDLLVQVRARARAPQSVVDLKRIDSLRAIRVDASGAWIGAAASCASIAAARQRLHAWPGFLEAAALIGSKQVQGRATIGGNLCNASPAADSVPALVANAAMVLVAGPEGPRRVAARDFCTGPGRNALARGEFVQALELPAPAPRTADAYLRFIPRTEMDIAVVGAAASVTLDADGACSSARIALGAVAPTVLEVPDAASALAGTRFDEEALAACVAAARAAARPISDRRGSADFRRHVVGVLVRRAVLEAARRARALN